MAYCPQCRKHFREPEEEQGEHDCPRCGLGPENDKREEEAFNRLFCEREEENHESKR